VWRFFLIGEANPWGANILVATSFLFVLGWSRRGLPIMRTCGERNNKAQMMQLMGLCRNFVLMEYKSPCAATDNERYTAFVTYDNYRSVKMLCSGELLQPYK
jgi:hypothetical protein